MIVRTYLAALVLVTALLATCITAPRCEAKEWESEKYNVELEIPDDPSPWEWLPFNADWSKYGIVKGAKRAITKLKNGKPGDGHGGIFHLAIRDAPKDKSLEDIAASDEVRKFLTVRFGGSAGEVESESFTVASGDQDDHPAFILRAEGKARNLRGKEADCTGVLLISVAKGKLFLVRMYAFPTEFDDEGIVVDLDYMEGNCLRIMKTKEKATLPPRPAENGGGKEGDEPEPEGEEKVLENRPQRWRLTKHKNVTQVEISDEYRKADMVLRFEGSDTHGGYAVYLYAIPHGRIVDGVAAPPPDLKRWIAPTWWQNFTTNHPKGDIFSYKWPKKVKHGGFLTVPHMEVEKNKVGVITKKKKRPVEITYSDAVKDLKFVDKPKKKNLGKRGKAVEAVRGILEGKRPRYAGAETLLRFAWRYREHSYRLIVTMYGQAYKKWGGPIRETLESLEFGVKFK